MSVKKVRKDRKIRLCVSVCLQCSKLLLCSGGTVDLLGSYLKVARGSIFCSVMSQPRCRTQESCANGGAAFSFAASVNLEVGLVLDLRFRSSFVRSTNSSVHSRPSR